MEKKVSVIQTFEISKRVVVFMGIGYSSALCVGVVLTGDGVLTIKDRKESER